MKQTIEAVELSKQLYDTLCHLAAQVEVLGQRTAQLELQTSTTNILPFVRKKEPLTPQERFAQIASYSDAFQQDMEQIRAQMAECRNWVNRLKTLNLGPDEDFSPTAIELFNRSKILSVVAYRELKLAIDELDGHFKQRVEAMKSQLFPH